MQEEIRLSIIIPAHNCADTLARAVRSIPQEEFIEVLIIENGSTDKTLNVAQNLAMNNKNIHVFISQKGVSFARNKGIEVANGSKILFLDADDFFLSGINNVVKCLPEGDLSIFSFESGKTKKKIFNRNTLLKGDKITVQKEKMLDNPTTYLTVWGKLFDLRLIRKNHLSFITDLRLSEDSLFLLQYLSFCSSINCCRTFLYHYSRGSDSTVRSFNITTVDDYMNSLVKVRRFIKNKEPELWKHYLRYGLMQLNLIGVHGIFDVNNSMSFLTKVGLLKQIVMNPVIAECLKGVSIKEMKNAKFIAIILIKLHMFFMAGQVFAMRSRFNS